MLEKLTLLQHTMNFEGPLKLVISTIQVLRGDVALSASISNKFNCLNICSRVCRVNFPLSTGPPVHLTGESGSGFP